MLDRTSSWWRVLTRRSSFENDMQDEMRFHMQAYSDDLVRGGVPPEEARRRAHLHFGSVPARQEECRQSHGMRWPDELGRNLRHSARLLRRSPAFTVTCVLTLALCIGANTAIFSVIDAELLRPLPYPEPDRLGEVVRFVRGPRTSGMQTSQDGETWEMLRDNASFLDCAVAGPGFTGVNLASGNSAEYVQQQRVSAGFFRVLGVAPLIGREFTVEEDREGGPPAAILSHELWQRLYGSDTAIIGRAALLRGEPHTVVGVMPAGFRTLAVADVWTPLRASRSGEGGGTNFMIIARLKRGVSWEQAGGQVNALGVRLNETRRYEPGVSVRFDVVPLQEGLTSSTRRSLLTMWGAVGIVLLIGCVNIAGLMLARARARMREIATRAALGAGRAAVVRQMLTESLLLACIGGLAGIAFGYAGMRALSASMHLWQEMRLDVRVLGASLLLTLLTSFAFGLLPALAASRIDIRSALIQMGGRGVAGSHSRWPRRMLVTTEVALGVVLLVGAGLLIRTFLHLRNLTPGFDATNVLTANVSLQDARYRTSSRGNRLFMETLERIRNLPGVEAAAVGLHVPYERWLNSGVRVVGDGRGDANFFTVNVNYVTPGYFEVLRIRAIAGRTFGERDTAGSAPVAIVNETFARRHFRDHTAIGRHVSFRGDRPPAEIVGIVNDVQQRAGWGEFGPMGSIPAVYVPATQVSDSMFSMVHTWFSPKWVVRATGSRESLIQGMQRAVQRTDPLLPFASFKDMDEVRGNNLQSQRFYAALLGTFAALALVLAAVGVYGLIANEVLARSRELGIRLALGATLRQAMVEAAAPGMVLSAIGVALGAGAALLAARVLRGMVYGLTTTDPATFAAVSALLLMVAAVASFTPALRVLRLDPSATLRQE